eukprot:1159571-Pelagomonas_calceolata.AAC.2
MARLVLLASGLLNPCLSRLERARFAAGWRRLNLLCWASNSCMRWWKFVFIAEASTGSADPRTPANRTLGMQGSLKGKKKGNSTKLVVRQPLGCVH